MRKKQKRRSRPEVVARTLDRGRATAFRILWAERLRSFKTLAAATVCALAVFLASWVGFFDLLKIDSWVERKFITYTAAFTYGDISPDIVLITAVEDAEANGNLGKPGPAWRRYHAQLLDALARAEARAVAFDLYFEDTSEDDQRLGEAIRRAIEAGTAVTVGVRKFDARGGSPEPLTSPVLRKHLTEQDWGFLEVGGVYKDTAPVRKLKLAAAMTDGLPSWVEVEEAKVVPSFALQVARAGLMLRGGGVSYNEHDGQVKLRDGSGQVVRSIPVDEGLNFIVDEKESATLDKINHPYHEVYKNLDNFDYLRSLFGGRVAIVGYKDKGDLRTSTKGESRYGVQIQANAVSDILQGIHISKPRPLSNFLIIAAMTAVGFTLGSRYRHLLRYRVPVEFSVVRTHLHVSLLPLIAGAVYLLLAVVLYQHNRTILGMTYHIAVLFLAFWLVSIVRRPASSRV